MTDPIPTETAADAVHPWRLELASQDLGASRAELAAELAAAAADRTPDDVPAPVRAALARGIDTALELAKHFGRHHARLDPQKRARKTLPGAVILDGDTAGGVQVQLVDADRVLSTSTVVLAPPAADAAPITAR